MGLVRQDSARSRRSPRAQQAVTAQAGWQPLGSHEAKVASSSWSVLSFANFTFNCVKWVHVV